MPARKSSLAPAPASDRLQADLAHRGWGDGDAETLELADDPAVPPMRILPRESQDQRAQRLLERRPPRLLVRIRPASGDQLAVPRQQRLRLHREVRPRSPRQRATQRGEKRAVNSGEM